jgi:uncharacterized protein (DUF2236 family)
MFHAPGVIALPRPLSNRMDAMAKTFLQPPGMVLDFSTPSGEPALVPPTSISWVIFKNPISLFIGGVSAVILEMAEPRVRDGVWDHSSFRTNALTRLQRTGLAAMMTVYGPRSKAEAMIAGVVRMHGRVNGETSEGEAYGANDQDLLDWVQATASFGFMEAYHAYVRPLDARQRDMLLAEAKPAANLYGAVGAPGTQDALDALFDTVKPRLVASPIVFEFLDIMEKVPALPTIARPLQHILIKAAVDILPHWVRDRLGLGKAWRLTPLERLIVKAAARTNDRIILPSSPAVQSCRRLGLPDDYLYRRRA